MSDWFPGGAEWDECDLELARGHHEWDRRKILGIRLSISDVKKAIYKSDAEYFKDALLSRLEEGAIQANHFSWRCIAEHIDDFSNSIVLLFEELPDSHHEGIIGHQINRLLEASREEKE